MKTEQIVVLMAATFLMAGSVSAMAADVFVYPKQNQSKDQQEQDTFSCYKWAKEQTGFDPTKPVAQASAPPPQGGAARGAAKGAAVGAIGGAIAGDAGKGAAVGAGVGAAGGAHRRRQAEKQQEAAQQQAEKQYEANADSYQRAFSVCMDGKGYSVK